MIWLKYIGKALTEEEFKLVRVIDDVILYYEFIYFMNESIFEEKPELKSNPTFVFEGFEQTENEFKQLFGKEVINKYENSRIYINNSFIKLITNKNISSFSKDIREA